MKPGDFDDYTLLDYLDQKGEEVYKPHMVEDLDGDIHFGVPFAECLSQLRRNKFVEEGKTQGYYVITTKGKKYLESLKAAQLEKQELSEKEKEKLDLEVILAKQQIEINNFNKLVQTHDYNIKRLNFLVAALAVIVSILGILVAIFK